MTTAEGGAHLSIRYEGRTEIQQVHSYYATHGFPGELVALVGTAYALLYGKANRGCVQCCVAGNAATPGRDDNSVWVPASTTQADCQPGSHSRWRVKSRNYNGNKSIGWPIQAVLWLEWAANLLFLRLFLQNGFCQVAWIVHINPVLDRQLVGKQLQRNHLQHGG